jgi:hypothetical protein
MLAVAEAGSGAGDAVGVAVAGPPPPRGTVDEPPLHPAENMATSVSAPASDRNGCAARSSRTIMV